MSSIGERFNDFCRQTETECKRICAQFEHLPPPLQARVIAKTVFVAALVGLGTSYLLGDAFSLITFTVTAVYVSKSILDRLYTGKNVDVFMKAFKEAFVTETKHAVKEVGTGIERGLEDLADDFTGLFRSNKENKTIEAKKRMQREAEDVFTTVRHRLDHFWIDFKMTMSL